MRPRPPFLVACVLLAAACDEPSLVGPMRQDTTGSGTATDAGHGTTHDAPPTDASSAPSTGETHGDTGGPQDEFPTDGFLGGFFPIGVFGQPAYAMESWSSVGCNTMFSIPDGDDLGMWDAEAQRLGLAVIRPPLADDLGRTDLLAWSLPDEPDIEANQAECGGDCIAVIESTSSQWRRLDPTRKIFVNVAGPNVLLQAACDYCNGPGDEAPSSCFPVNDACYPRILATSDWISQDIYPVTGWLPAEDLREDVTVVGKTLDRLREWTDKPLFAVIEISDQRLGFPGTGTRGPTPAEYRAELWHAIIHGARGVFYFPQAFNPFEFDSVDRAVLEEMVVQHELITTLAPLLQATANPDNVAIAVDAPLEVTWRQTEHHTWVFALDTAGVGGTGFVRIPGAAGEATVYDEARSLLLADGGITDSFEPHQLHIYVVARTR